MALLTMGDFVEDELDGSDGDAVVSITKPISLDMDGKPRPSSSAASSSSAWTTFASAFLSALGSRPATPAAAQQATAAAAAKNRNMALAFAGIAGAVVLGAVVLSARGS